MINPVKRFFYFPLILIINLLLISCKTPPLKVGLTVPPALSAVWNTLIAKYPIPQGVLLTNNSPHVGKNTLVLKRFFSNEGKPYRELSAGNREKYTVIIDRQWYAPKTKLWELPTVITAQMDISSLLVPLNSIKMPDNAFAIKGLFPDNSRYPGVQITTVTLTLTKIKDKTNPVLIRWIKELSDETAKTLAKHPKVIWIAGVGDIMVQRGVEDTLLNSKNGLRTIFNDTLPVLENEDLLLGNLEGSITRRTVKIPKSYNFKFNPKVLTVLHRAGFDYLSQTNNHIYDYGKEGFIDSLRYLKNSPIATSGAGMTIKEAQAYWETSIRGQTIRVLSIGAYPRENNGFDGKTQASVSSTRPGILFAGPLADEAVRHMVSPDTFDIIFIHGGKEWHSTPTKQQKALYRSYIDMGADLILGSHPHVLQGIEARNGKLIVYSLGNFIFPGMGGMPYGENSMILSLGIVNGEIKYVLPIPVKINNKILHLDKRTQALDRYLKLIKEQN